MTCRSAIIYKFFCLWAKLAGLMASTTARVGGSEIAVTRRDPAVPTGRAAPAKSACFVPKTFNFAADVVVTGPIERPGELLIWCNDRGSERRFTFAEISEDLLAPCGECAAQTWRPQGRPRHCHAACRVPAWQIAMVAIARIGAVAVPYVTMLTEKDVAYRVANAEVAGVVTTLDQVEVFLRLGCSMPPLRRRCAHGLGRFRRDARGRKRGLRRRDRQCRRPRRPLLYVRLDRPAERRRAILAACSSGASRRSTG